MDTIGIYALKEATVSININIKNAIWSETTMDRTDNAYKLTRGISIFDEDYTCTLVSHVVTFIYTSVCKRTFEETRDNNIQIPSSVKRRAYAFTQISDGTRNVKVKFPP